jgi:hypothetical protein
MYEIADSDPHIWCYVQHWFCLIDVTSSFDLVDEKERLSTQKDGQCQIDAPCVLTWQFCCVIRAAKNDINFWQLAYAEEKINWANENVICRLPVCKNISWYYLLLICVMIEKTTIKSMQPAKGQQHNASVLEI